MENKDKNYTYYKNLSLKEAIREHATCIDDEGNIINQEKFFMLLENDEFRKYLFSEDKLLENALQERNLIAKAAAEHFFDKSFPPSWYWKMPDYYYPGIYSENLQGDIKPYEFVIDDEAGKIRTTTTRNEAVLNDCGWKRAKYDIPEYFNDDFPTLKMVFSKNSNSIQIVNIDPTTKEELRSISLPFGLLCGMFLKCRELEFDKPWELRAHDYKNQNPQVFEHDHKIVRDPETKEIIDYGDWKPENNDN